MYHLPSRSGRAAPQSAMSYGPYGLLQALMVGFVLGCVLFVIGDAVLNPTPGIGDLPALILCAGGATALVTAAAVAENYRIGRVVREQVELERAMFSRAHFDPPPFDEDGNRLRPQANVAAGSFRQPPRREPAAAMEAAAANADQRDTSSASANPLSPELGRPAFSMDEHNGHELSTAARH